MSRETKFLSVVTLFISMIVISYFISSKLVSIFGFTFSVGAFAYAFTFFCTDVISECYGKRKTQHVVTAGFAAIVITVLFSQFAVHYPPAAIWLDGQEAFATVLGSIPRLAIAGAIAYLISQYWDINVFHYIRKKTGNKKLWLRNNASTMSSQLIDSILFVFIAFWGVVPNGVLVSMMLTQYVVKAIIALIDTPFIYLGRKWIGVTPAVVERHQPSQ